MAEYPFTLQNAFHGSSEQPTFPAAYNNDTVKRMKNELLEKQLYGLSPYPNLIQLNKDVERVCVIGRK